MLSVNYNDGLRHAGRTPRLYLTNGEVAHKFLGDNLPGCVTIATEKFTKNGKWSNTDYLLHLSPGFRALSFLSPLHGVWGDDLGSWAEVATKLQLPLPLAQEIIRHEYPKTAARLDAVEVFAAEVGKTALENVVVSFGSPTNREIKAGWWNEPKSALSADGQTKVVIQPHPVRGWNEPSVVQPESARIVNIVDYPVMHGGSFAITVAVPISE